MNQTLRIINKVSISKTLKQILLDKPQRDIEIRPGDYIEIGDLSLPIIDIIDMQGTLRILTLYEGELPDTKFVEIENTNPSKGKISIIGSIHNPIIATFRINGYEVFNNNVKKADLIIVTEPNTPSIDFKEKVLVAPTSTLGLSDYQQLNNLLRNSEAGILFNLNKPITQKKDLTLEVDYFRRKIYVKTLVNAYHLKVKEGSILSTINEGDPVIAASNKKKILVASSINLLYPFDLIYKKGENSLLLLDIVEKNDLFKAKRKTKKVAKTKPITLDKTEIRIEIKNLEPQLVFQKTINLLTKLGAVITQKNDTTRQAQLKLTPPLGKNNIQISTTENTLLVKCQNCPENTLRNFRAITSLIESFITDLSQEHINKEKIRILIRALATFHKKLLIAKDMLELDINAGEIQNELCEAYAAISTIDFLEEIANEIAEYCRAKREVDPLKPYPTNIKQKLLNKIDEWYEKATILSEKNI